MKPFCTNNMLANLAQISHVAAEVAQNIATNFTIRLDTLQSKFQETADVAAYSFNTGLREAVVKCKVAFTDAFTAIDDIAHNSALLKSEAFGAANGEIIAGALDMKQIGKTAFEALKEKSVMFTDIWKSGMQTVVATASKSTMSLNDYFLVSADKIKAIWAGLVTHCLTLSRQLSDDIVASSVVTRDNIFAHTTEIGNMLLNLQALGTGQFELLSQNVIASFASAKDSIFADSYVLGEKIAETGSSMKENMRHAFSGIATYFSDMLGFMCSESAAQFGNVTSEGEITSSSIKSSFSVAFYRVLRNLKSLSTAVAPILSAISNMFAETAQKAEENFRSSISIICEKIIMFGGAATESCEEARNAFNKANSSLTEMVEKMIRLNIILGTYNGLIIVMKSIKGAAVGISAALATVMAIKGTAAKFAAIKTAALKSALSFGLAAIPIAAHDKRMKTYSRSAKSRKLTAKKKVVSK